MSVDDDDLAAWIAGLDDLFALVAGRCFLVVPRLRDRAYVRACWRPRTAGRWPRRPHAMPTGMQRLLNRAAWDADGVRDDLRGYVARHLGAADRVLRETGF